jgi:hypothetical protein
MSAGQLDTAEPGFSLALHLLDTHQSPPRGWVWLYFRDDDRHLEVEAYQKDCAPLELTEGCA